MKELSNLKVICEELAKEDKKKAEEFYFKEVFPKVKEMVQKRAEGDNLVEKYEGIILTTGLSPEPLILTITALKPKRVLFLCTKESEKYLDKIVKECNLLPTQYSKAIIERSDGSDVYEEIKKKWEKWNFNKIAIDMTGATKPIVGGSAVAGSFLNVDLLYVDSKYGWVLMKSEPGSERIVKLSNPFEIFGDLEEKRAIELFNSHNYTIGAEFFGKLKGLTRDPRRFEVKQLLAEGYGAWDRFNFKEGYSRLKEAVKKANQYGVTIDERIKTHIDILKILRKNLRIRFFKLLQDGEFAFHLIIDVYCNAKRRIEQGRYDDAIIRFYRILELIAQYKLAKKGIDTSKVKVSNQIEREFKKLSKKLYGSEREVAEKIGLMEAWLLLFVLKDESLKNFSDIDEIKNRIIVRNELIIEHQNKLGSFKDCKEFEDFVRKWLLKIVDDFDRMVAKHDFIRL